MRTSQIMVLLAMDILQKAHLLLIVDCCNWTICGSQYPCFIGQLPDSVLVAAPSVACVQAAKRKLQQRVEWPLQHADAFARLGLDPARGVLLHGPPGCCKTSLALAVASSSRANIIPLSASSLYSMCDHFLQHFVLISHH
jgi:hypothetical protein